MIKIIRHYTTPEGKPAIEYEVVGGGYTGTGHSLTKGQSDAEVVARIEKRLRRDEAYDQALEAEDTNPSNDPPPPGSLQHRMQTEFEASNPYAPAVSKEWTSYWEKKWAEERGQQQPAEAAQ